jgi:hypothetical protein
VFTLGDVLCKRIDTLVLDEPVWIMAALPGHAASPFENLLHRFDDAGLPPGPRHTLPRLSVRHLAIRGGRIVPPPDRAAATVDLAATLTVDAAQWSIDVHASMGTQVVQASARLCEAGDHADGTVLLRIPGARAIVFDGTCRLGWASAHRVLAVAVRRRPGPFEVALASGIWSGDGDLELQVEVPFSQLDTATLAVRVRDFRVATTGVEISGLAADLHLLGLPMPVSVGPQHVSWEGMQLASAKAGSGKAALDLRSGAELHAQIRLRTTDEIGSIDISDLRLTPGLDRFPATVVFDQVPLREWLELLSGGRITGEGRLSGSLTMVVQTEPRLAIDLQGGRLAAAPGGVVRFLDDAETEGLIRQHVEQIAASTSLDASVQQRLVAALKEFAFTVLDFRIDPDAEGDGVTLRVHTAGQGRRVPQELDVSVNLHGFDTAVDTAIALKLGLDRAKDRVAHKIDERPNSIPMQRKP